MFLKELANILRDAINFVQVFIAQADVGQNPAVVHLPGILNRIRSEHGIRDIKWSAVKSANSCVVPANGLNCSFEIVCIDPVTFSERSIEKQHEPGEKVLTDLLGGK